MNERIELAAQYLKKGGERSFEKALETLTASAFAFAKKLCGNTQDAEDIAQETMLRLAPSLDRFSNSRGLAVWLYKVAKTRCLMSRRASKFAPAQTLSLDHLMPSSAESMRAGAQAWDASPEEFVLRNELRAELERAVLSLPEHYRLVLVLRDMEQLDTAEVAEVMGLSPPTVKMRLHRARVMVRNALADYFSTIPEVSVARD